MLETIVNIFWCLA